MPHSAPALQRPAKASFIAFTLFLALMLNLLPWQGLLLAARPDFLLLVLLYWAVNQPLRVGMAVAWAMGIVMDVADGALLGQYALAYTVTIFLALTLHRRIQSFGLWPQALHVSVLLLVSQGLVLLIHLASGADFIGWHYFLASATGTLLWAPLALLIQYALEQKSLAEAGYQSARNGDN